MKAIYFYGKNGKSLTKEGRKMWERFEEVFKEVKNCTFFLDCDNGELADLFSEEFPRLNRFDMYQYIVAMRQPARNP